jgi:hypothetical protein
MQHNRERGRKIDFVLHIHVGVHLFITLILFSHFIIIFRDSLQIFLSFVYVFPEHEDGLVTCNLSFHIDSDSTYATFLKMRSRFAL